MGYLVGTDEAGYGPNLGPLVISATVWQIPDDAPTDDLYQLLKKAIVPQPPRSPRPGGKVAMADSKQLYNPGKGLALLERGLLAALGLFDDRPATWRALWNALSPSASEALAAAPWYANYDCPLPLEVDGDDLDLLAPKLRSVCDSAGVRLLAIRSRTVFPAEWNELLDLHGTKGAALSNLTIALLCQVLESLPGCVSVICDKHGGRNCYGALLQQHVGDVFVEVHGESRAESIYRWGPSDRRIEVRFRPRAETYLPAALASMASKYLREAAMRAFNHYWCQQVPDLRPTAGYPQDAKRFKDAIGPMQAALGFDDALLWRLR